MQESRKQIDYATENCRLAQDNLGTISLGYAEERLTILDVLAAQLTWLQANTNLIQSHHNYRMALANYRHATGSD
jgi:outer membrane protein TolC